jgi:hypothetical protein
MNNKLKRWGLRGSAIGIAALVTSVGVGTAVSSASPRPAARVSHGAVAVTNWSNTLATNTNGWCTYSGGCNGAAGSYGTIDVVSHTFSNYGGYAPAVTGPVGQTNSYARVTGASDTPSGCPTPGGENCSGPYTTFGNNNNATAFPTKGFTTSLKIYLSSSWAAANPGQVVDWDTALNNTSASYLQDFIFNLCTTSAGGGGFYESTSSNAGGCTSGPNEITTSGWYTFKMDFHTVGSNVDVTYSIQNSINKGVVPTTTVNTGHATSSVGGTSYGWLPDEDILGLPIAKSALALNS